MPSSDKQRITIRVNFNCSVGEQMQPPNGGSYLLILVGAFTKSALNCYSGFCCLFTLTGRDFQTDLCWYQNFAIPINCRTKTTVRNSERPFICSTKINSNQTPEKNYGCCTLYSRFKCVFFKQFMAKRCKKVSFNRILYSFSGIFEIISLSNF